MPSVTPSPRPRWTPPHPERPARGTCGLWGLPRLTHHRIGSPRWTAPDLRIAVIADPHVCHPWAHPRIIARIVDQVQDLGADLILLSGDFLPDRFMPCRHPRAERIIPLFAGLSAPLGVFAIMGNHDYVDDPRARASDGQDSAVRDELARAGIPCLSNTSVAISHGTRTFHLVGLDSQFARGRNLPGREDPEAAFAALPKDSPTILLAHEPDYFARGDDRAVVQISGHTHGGQFVVFGRRPMTPSNYGDRYAIGHHRDGDRHLIVSAGLGYSGLPLRFGVPPEITLIEMTHSDPAHPGRI